MSEHEAHGAEFVADCKRLAEAVVADLFDDAHCPACGWTLFAAYAVLIGVDHWLEEALEKALENFGAGEDTDEEYEKYVDSCHTNIERYLCLTFVRCGRLGDEAEIRRSQKALQARFGLMGKSYTSHLWIWQRQNEKRIG